MGNRKFGTDLSKIKQIPGESGKLASALEESLTLIEDAQVKRVLERVITQLKKSKEELGTKYLTGPDLYFQIQRAVLREASNGEYPSLLSRTIRLIDYQDSPFIRNTARKDLTSLFESAVREYHAHNS